ncbi:MAG: dihydrodipicolinate synthase family protein [Bryobacteraceae bacterium]|nr:dihydrodipicolinate synthase family protein [Bryobacteraceae bacterium]MDW8379841.1 dihydrodipicolinate synthase family protein [Bryobacterales bacterium]
MQNALRQTLISGLVIPAHPLALTRERKLDERRQRALTRYYVAAGAGGVAVAVHTTQFAIREHGLLEPVLALAAEQATGILKIAGVCGPTTQAVREAELAAKWKYDAALVSFSALQQASIDELVEHTKAVAEILPVFGFYLQPAVGGRLLPYRFWRRFVEIDNVVAIKIAPFNRYQTLDVVRAVAESGRGAEIALYTGNDDNILVDLVTLFEFPGLPPVRITGGLLGQWAVWTHRAVELLGLAKSGATEQMLRWNVHLTDANSAIFDAANHFHGCIAGIHEVLRRQGFLEGIWCLDPNEGLSPGQAEEIDRVIRLYPHLTDDDFVREHLDEWLAG